MQSSGESERVKNDQVSVAENFQVANKSPEAIRHFRQHNHLKLGNCRGVGYHRISSMHPSMKLKLKLKLTGSE